MAKKDIVELRMQERALKLKMREKLVKELLVILRGVEVDVGYSLPELAMKAFNKARPSSKDLRMVYDAIRIIREDSDECLAYIHKKYGWAKDKGTIDTYRMHNVENGLLKVKSNVSAIVKNYVAVGIKESPRELIQEKAKEFGMKMLN